MVQVEARGAAAVEAVGNLLKGAEKEAATGRSTHLFASDLVVAVVAEVDMLGALTACDYPAS